MMNERAMLEAFEDCDNYIAIACDDLEECIQLCELLSDNEISDIDGDDYMGEDVQDHIGCLVGLGFPIIFTAEGYINNSGFDMERLDLHKFSDVMNKNKFAVDLI